MVKGPAVVVVGSINEDVVLRLARPVHSGETVTAVAVERGPGGKGANQAVAAARAGAAVTMIGRVGDDPAGGRMLDALGQEGVATGAVRRLPGVATGAAYITVTPNGESTIVLDPGANARLRADDIKAEGETLARTAVLVAQLEVPLDAVVAAVGLATASGVRAVVSLTPVQPVPDQLLAGLDPLLVNEHEAASFLRDPDVGHHPEAAARQLLERGPRSAVITLGARGAAIADRSGTRLVPAFPVAEVVDTTGAGDAFAGALAAALAGGHDLDQAVQAGLGAAAEVIGRAGAR